MNRYVLSFFLLLSVYASAQDDLLYILKAKFNYEHQDYANAFKYLDSTKHKNFYTDFLIGNIYNQQKETKKAITAYHLCNQKKAHFADFEMAENYVLQQQYDSALVYLEQHLQSPYKQALNKIKINPIFSDFQNSKQWETLQIEHFYTKEEKLIEQAVYYKNNSELDLALDILDELIAQNKNNTEAYFYRAKFIIALNQDYKYAIGDLKKALKIESQDYKYHRYLAYLYFSQMKYKKALASYLKAQELSPYHLKDIFLIAKTYYRTGDYENATQWINRYIDIDYRNIDALVLAGQIYYDKKKYKESIETLTQAIYINPRRIDVLVARGKSYLEADLYPQAGRDFNIALDLDTQNGELWYLKGLAFLYQEKKDEACRYFKKASYLNYYRADEYLLKECQ